MRRILLVLTLGVLATPYGALAQNFAGNYSLQSPEGAVTMSIQPGAGGTITGAVTMEDGSVVNLQGQTKGAEAFGIAAFGEKSILFKLHHQGAQLLFTMIPVTADNKPDMASAQEFAFTRQGQGGGATTMQPAPSVYQRYEAEGEQEDISAGNPLGPGGPGTPLAVGAGSPAADPFARTFADAKMKLRLNGQGGRYQGQIQFQGQTFPVTAQSADGRTLKGKFTSGGNSFEFSGTLHGSTLNFSTGGTTYQLQSQGGAPAATGNPLGGSAGRPQPAAASGGSAGQPIPGGNIVNDPPLGVRFSVPPGWKHEKQQANYIMGHDTIPGMIIVMPHNYNSIQEVAAAAGEPLYQAQDGHLMVSGQPVTLAQNIIAADYSGHLQGNQAMGRIVGVVSPFGGGFLVMAGTTTQHYGPQYAQLAENVARSMSFSKPQLPPEAAMWKQKLTGMRLAYLKSGGSSDIGGYYGWSEEKDIYLCSDGSFQASGQFSGSIGATGGSAIMDPGRKTSAGQWAITGQTGQPALQLRLNTGDVQTYILSTDGSKTYLDGKQWFVVENPVCR
jgi:hypothetical protein